MAKKVKENLSTVLRATGDGFKESDTDDLEGVSGAISWFIYTNKATLVLLDECKVGEKSPRRWNLAETPSGTLLVTGWLDSQDRDKEQPDTIAMFAAGFWRSVWSPKLQAATEVDAAAPLEG